MNVEANHATLAGHSFAHDLQMATDAGLLGSVDANRGDPQNGWDTDQFPTDTHDCTQAMLVILAGGGFTSGGLNFDAKIRRESTRLEDMFIAHIGGMDAFARGLVFADRMLNDKQLTDLKHGRYHSFGSGPGAEFAAGELSLVDLRDHAERNGEPESQSGRQELVENRMNDHMFR